MFDLRVWLVVAALAGCYERGTATSRAEPPPDDASLAAQPRVPALPEAVDPVGSVDPDARLRVRLEAEPAHLNPLIAGEAVALRVTVGDVYEGLYCRATPTADPSPCLARAIEVDGARVTVHLRAGVTWHDGRAFTAADVVFTYRAIAGAGASWLAPSVAGLRAVRARGDDRVELELARPPVRLTELLADVPILPRHLFAGDVPMERAAANRAPVGTGPLRFVSWKPGESLTFARYPDYWGAPAKAAVVTYRIVANRSRALALLAAGGLDLAPQLPVDEAVRAADDSADLRLYGYAQPAFLAAVYNLRRPALAEAGARRALTMLLDRATVARTLLGGRAEVASGPYPAGSPLADSAVVPAPFDPTAARALLPARPRLTVLTPAGSRIMGSVADIWASDARVAAALRVEVVPYAELVARVRAGNFDIALMAFTTSRDPDLYNRFHSSQIGGENYGALADAELDDLLEQARVEADPAARVALGRAIHRRLAALQPYAFIAGDVRAGLARRDIGGLAAGAGLAARYLWRAR